MKTHQDRLELEWIFAGLEGKLMDSSKQYLRVCLIGISMLLTTQTLACPCPPCPGCQRQTGTHQPNCNCVDDDSNCTGCESCVSGSCVDDSDNCPTGKYCSEGNCETCCDECQFGDQSPGMNCINGHWHCIYGMCLDGYCVDVDVYVSDFPDPDEQVINCDVVFTAETIAAGYESHISWSGGGTPATGSGASFTTRWSTQGTKTVTARIDSCDGWSTWDSVSVEILECIPIESLNDLENCQNRIQTPGYSPTTNGCSAPMGNNPTRDCPYPPTCLGTNENCVSTSFEGPCNTHDTCYGTCNGTSGYGKYDCDTTFGADMHAVCEALTGDEFDSCYDDCDWWADTYVVAVYLVGQSYYDNGQVAGCSCVDCE